MCAWIALYELQPDTEDVDFGWDVHLYLIIRI